MVVLLTIHQPRTDILELFDNIILLSAGKTVWCGTSEGAISHFEKLGWPLPDKTNPSDFFLDIITLDARNKTLREESAARIEKFDAAWRLHERENPLPAPAAVLGGEGDDFARGKSLSWLPEFGILLERNLKDLWRDKGTLGATFGQAIFLGLYSLKWILALLF